MALDFGQLGQYFQDLASTGLLVSLLMKFLTENFSFVRGLHRLAKVVLVHLLGVGVALAGSFLGYLQGELKEVLVYGLLSGMVAAGLYDAALRPIMDALVQLAKVLLKQQK